MNYELIKEAVDMVREFEKHRQSNDAYPADAFGFRKWIIDNSADYTLLDEPDWEGKEKGRSAESVINTLLVHMNRYAKNYSKSAIQNSDFSTQEDFIYLINLKAFGAMTKMELIKKNLQDKPVGMQIINRLIRHGWVHQSHSTIDKRSKVIAITSEGEQALEVQMKKIRQATTIVAGNLTKSEKFELIRLLQKLNRFHQPIYHSGLDSESLIDVVLDEHFKD